MYEYYILADSVGTELRVIDEITVDLDLLKHS